MEEIIGGRALLTRSKLATCCEDIATIGCTGGLPHDDNLLSFDGHCFCCVRCSLHVEEEFSLDRNSGVPHWPPRTAVYEEFSLDRNSGVPHWPPRTTAYANMNEINERMRPPRSTIADKYCHSYIGSESIFCSSKMTFHRVQFGICYQCFPVIPCQSQ